MRAHLVLRLIWILASTTVLLILFWPRHRFDKYQCPLPNGNTTFQDRPCAPAR